MARSFSDEIGVVKKRSIANNTSDVHANRRHNRLSHGAAAVTAAAIAANPRLVGNSPARSFNATTRPAGSVATPLVSAVTATAPRAAPNTTNTGRLLRCRNAATRTPPTATTARTRALITTAHANHDGTTSRPRRNSATSWGKDSPLTHSTTSAIVTTTGATIKRSRSAGERDHAARGFSTITADASAIPDPRPNSAYRGRVRLS